MRTFAYSPHSSGNNWAALKKTIHDTNYLEMIACLRAAREKAKFSQRDLAGKIGKPQSYISKIEACERRIDLLETLELCTALGIQLESIVPSHLRHLITRATP